MDSNATTTPVNATEAIATSTTSKSSNPVGVIKRTNAFFVDPKTITRREGWNPRFDFGEIDELAKSIKANGILNPIRVKRLPTVADGKVFELIDGDRRLTAIESLLKKGHEFPEGIPALIVNKDQEDLTSLIQMFVANDQKSFLPMEEAVAYKRMRDAKMSIKQICEAVGRKHVHVVAILALLEAGDELKDATKLGEINKTLAKDIAVIAKGDKVKQAELVAQAKSAGKDQGKRRELKKAIEVVRQDKAKAKGKVLKIRALDDLALSALGSKMAGQLMEMMETVGLPKDHDFRAWLADDADLKMAYAFGALEALKVAAGAPDNLIL